MLKIKNLPLTLSLIVATPNVREKPHSYVAFTYRTLCETNIMPGLPGSLWNYAFFLTCNECQAYRCVYLRTYCSQTNFLKCRIYHTGRMKDHTRFTYVTTMCFKSFSLATCWWIQGVQIRALYRYIRLLWFITYLEFVWLYDCGVGRRRAIQTHNLPKASISENGTVFYRFFILIGPLL